MITKIIPVLTAAALMFSCAACTSASGSAVVSTAAATAIAPQNSAGKETVVVLADSGSSVDGAAMSTDPTAAVYSGADIVYYEAGKDETYGEGTQTDAHTADEAAAQTVITITQPGTYRISGVLSAGQLAVDLGEDAASDPSAVVTLLLDGADITCTVAPAILFYRAYECSSADTNTASATPDTTAAGVNVILADGSVNNIDGSYVAKIYKEGTDKKLHKYDGAFYAKMSMNVYGETAGTGELHITAANEGLDSELHLTINGGKIWITAQNDGINTSEDGVSVTTINGGVLTIDAGLGAEGDGIDSNGYLVINGGEIVTLGNGKAGDGGLDSDKGIALNGGTVLALGSRNDAIDQGSTQAHLEFNFSATQGAGSVLTIADADGAELLRYTAIKEYQSLIYTASGIQADADYTVAIDGVTQENAGSQRPGGAGQGPQGERPADFDPTQSRSPRPEGTPPQGTPPVTA